LNEEITKLILANCNLPRIIQEEVSLQLALKKVYWVLKWYLSGGISVLDNVNFSIIW